MLVQLQHSYLLINRMGVRYMGVRYISAIWESGAEAVTIWDGVLAQQ